MQSGKAPGIDGLPVDFYKAFWPEMGRDLLRVLRDSLRTGRLALSCRRAVLTLLPKKGDLQDIKNWRPVSLLCSDYKLLSKVLATRLRKVMESVIHVDQTYCVPGRLISDNVTLIRDILDLSRALGFDLGLISLDQEKAFDRVEHLYLWRTLEAMGFGSGFIAMIRVLYGDIESVLKINGGLGAPFKVERGIRQGCSMSGMLYSLSLEPFLHRLRAQLSGVSLPGCMTNFKMSVYADDLIILVTTQRDIDVLNKTVCAFKKISSAKVNWLKSEAVAVGNASTRTLCLPGGLTWRSGGLKYLGVYLGDETFIAQNWTGVLEAVEGRLKKWKWILPRMSYRG
uniref:Reverse transcriptase domain-containing protein n=1 Tax=Gouania willdenowi TaxID=441366 RepID=A0A8C5E548_GOUWI